MISEPASVTNTTHAGRSGEPARPMRLLVTGGTGVLWRAMLPMAREAGHTVVAPRHADLDLVDPEAVRHAVEGADAVLHLATRIPSLDKLDQPDAWRENDRLRVEASALLVSAALETTTSVDVQPAEPVQKRERGLGHTPEATSLSADAYRWNR